MNRNKAMWARLWRRRGRRTNDHEFYDRHEASPYRSEAEARGSWNPPGGDSMWAPHRAGDGRPERTWHPRPTSTHANRYLIEPRPTTIKNLS